MSLREVHALRLVFDHDKDTTTLEYLAEGETEVLGVQVLPFIPSRDITIGLSAPLEIDTKMLSTRV